MLVYVEATLLSFELRRLHSNPSVHFFFFFLSCVALASFIVERLLKRFRGVGGLGLRTH